MYLSDHHEILTQFFLDPDVIFSSHTMLINASTKDFTPINLVTFSIRRLRIRTRCRPSEGRRCIPDVDIQVHVETYLNVDLSSSAQVKQ